ncbi:undecaprenyl diphosphate synthase family protein [Candidatus Saccharibacteria bacterium]|nr:undecaprenyl diphosphate synthase family protein [Candidatus Saccharibacteria bacterium]
MKLNMNHLALILDGNRRWGKAHGLKVNVDLYNRSSLFGLDVAEAAFDRGIDNLTIWIGSVSNLTKRPALEIKALNKAYKKFFADPNNSDFAHQRQIKFDCFGRWRELLEPTTVRVIEKAIADTAQYANSGRRLTVLLGYDGTDERGAALKKVLEEQSNTLSETVNNEASLTSFVKAGLAPNRQTVDDEAKRGGDGLDGRMLDEAGQVPGGLVAYAQLLRVNSWTGHLPDVDLIIRTGCAADPHNSAGFLSMLADNTQYAFLETLWPDFTPKMLHQILDDFATRERRMGK